MTTDDKSKVVTELLDQAVKTYEHALKTGVKLQEESAKCFTQYVHQNSSPQDWVKRVQSAADNWGPQTQKTLEEGLKVLEQSSRSSVDLLKRAVAAGQATSLPDAQTRLLGLWEASLQAMRDTAVSVTQANHRAIESWAAYTRQSTEPTSPGGKG